jgi:hypothetical protein
MIGNANGHGKLLYAIEVLSKKVNILKDTSAIK